MSGQLLWVVNFANSILGVGILALPYCFQQCGIVLTTVMILVSGYITKVTCHYLLRTASVCRKSTYEQMAFHIYGPLGKLVTEICTIGLLLGTLVAFQVVIGDLAPAVVHSVMGIEKSWFLRFILMCIANLIIFPICMMRNVANLASLNLASVCFYFVFIFVMFCFAAPHLFFKSWWKEVHLWNTPSFFQCLPIISLAFSCQTQVFTMYSALSDPNTKVMTEVIKKAINLCSTVYILVGFFGYIAFYHQKIQGNILGSFHSGIVSDFIQLGFCLSVILSFPLIVFPVRTSINSMLFGNEGQGVLHDVISSSANYIAPDIFFYITICLTSSTLVVGILIPHIEVVLSITGALVGTFLCFVLPSTLFIVGGGGDKMKRGAKVILLFSILSMVFSTMTVVSNIATNSSKTAIVEEVINPVLKEFPIKVARNNETPLDKKLPNNDGGAGDLTKVTIIKPHDVKEGQIIISDTNVNPMNEPVKNNETRALRLEPPINLENNKINALHKNVQEKNLEAQNGIHSNDAMNVSDEKATGVDGKVEAQLKKNKEVIKQSRNILAKESVSEIN